MTDGLLWCCLLCWCGALRARVSVHAGTVTHQPPELLLQGHMSKAVDVYSWGVVVWEMVTGRRPFAGMSHSQVLHSIGIGRLLELPAGLPSGLRSLMADCMAPDPASRWVGIIVYDREPRCIPQDERNLLGIAWHHVGIRETCRAGGLRKHLCAVKELWGMWCGLQGWCA